MVLLLLELVRRELGVVSLVVQLLLLLYKGYTCDVLGWRVDCCEDVVRSLLYSLCYEAGVVVKLLCRRCYVTVVVMPSLSICCVAVVMLFSRS